MSARIYDANGDEVPVRVMRRRMGFMGGDLLPDDELQNDPPNFHTPSGSTPVRGLGNGTHREEEL